MFTLALLFDHVPPVVPSESAIVAPIHTTPGPVISDGNGFTVAIADVAQPEGRV